MGWIACRAGRASQSARLLLAAGLLFAVSARADKVPVEPVEKVSSEELEARVREATVTLVPAVCAGVIVGAGTHVLTAAHCLQEDEQRLTVELHDGSRLEGSLESIDRGLDLALVRLDRPAPVRGLAVAEKLPEPGERVLFAGRNDRPGAAQLARVRRLGRCPSLPGVPSALFTDLQGRKGDSGCPVVDGNLQVVGLVHGGAACNIATPTHELAGAVNAPAPLAIEPQATERRAPSLPLAPLSSEPDVSPVVPAVE